MCYILRLSFQEKQEHESFQQIHEKSCNKIKPSSRHNNYDSGLLGAQEETDNVVDEENWAGCNTKNVVFEFGRLLFVSLFYTQTTLISFKHDCSFNN